MKIPQPNSITVQYKSILLALALLFVSLVLVFSIRGYTGNPSIQELNSQRWTFDGPFELSPERGRFALMYSIVESKSFYFPVDVARFALPDLGYFNDKYVSLFAPAVSYIIAPGYILGKTFNASQIGAFAVVALFAVLNCLLIYKISRHIGASYGASILAFFIFIFGTPAYAYATTLYQHHISTFVILLALYLCVKYNNFLSVGIVWFLCAISLSIDYPNLFMMLPIGFATVGKIVKIKLDEKQIKVGIKLPYILTITFVALPMLFFFWFNKNSYGNPLQLAGSVTQVKDIDQNGNPSITEKTVVKDLSVKVKEDVPVEAASRNPLGFFNTRNMLNGFFLLFISPDRGTISFAPIILLGFFGIITLYKHKSPYLNTLVGVLMFNIIIYTMWGDPWGGWAFGARYLIPGYAILAILVSIVLTHLKTKWLLIPVFVIFIYSAYINCAGAITSNMNPPKVEVLELEKLSGTVQKYTVERNLDLLKANYSKAFIFQSYARNNMHAMQYFNYLFGSIFIITGVAFAVYILRYKRHE